MLIAFAIFGISVAVGLVTLVLYLNPGLFGRHETSIPGPLVIDAKEGNLLEISKLDGSLHRYLSQIHKQYGRIVAFFMGKQLVVSLSSYDLVLEHINAFNSEPGRLFQLYEAIVPRHYGNATGRVTSSKTKNNDPTIGFQQRAQEAKIKSIRWSTPSLTHFSQRYVALAYEMANKWMAQTTRSAGKSGHIGLVSSCLGLGAKCASVSLLGEFYADDRVVFEFKRKADKYWSEISDRLADGVEVSERREKAIRDSLEELQRVMKGHVQCWFEAEKSTLPSRWTMTDYLMDKDLPQDEVAYQLLCYFLVMLNSVGHIVSWTIYNLAKNPSAHDRLVEELRSHFSRHDADSTTREVWESCATLRHVVMETVRQVPLVTWTSRTQDFELPCGGDAIPASSLVLYAVGDLCYDRDIWGSKPQEFRPQRFQEDPKLEEVMRTLLPIPKPDEMDRMFPTFSFSFVVASILVAELALKFHFRLVAPEDGAAVGSRDPAAADSDALDDDELAPPTELGFGGCGRADAPKNFKMLTTPLEEIWVTVTPRN